MRATPNADPNRFVRRCWRCSQRNKRIVHRARESRPSTRYSNRVQVAPSEGQIEGQPRADSACNRVMCDTDSVVIAKRCDENDCWEFGYFPEINCYKDITTQSTAKPPPELKVSKLQYVGVTVNGNNAVALCDSGSQIPIVSSRLLEVSDGYCEFAGCCW